MRLVIFYFACLLAFFSSFAFSQTVQQQSTLVPTPQTVDIIKYKYYYTSIITLDSQIDIDERRNWYVTFRQAVDSCMKQFVYPEDFNASVEQAREQFRKDCYYKTVIEINNFENNLYFEKKKPIYNLYETNPVFANILSETLECEDCSLYPNKNSDIVYLDAPLVPGKKIRVFSLNSTQKDIFSNIFSLTHDKIRFVDAQVATVIRWANKINAATNRSALKFILDDFVNHIEFEPIETKEQIIQAGEKVYLQGK